MQATQKISEVCLPNQVSATAMTSASDEKWRPFNCFFSRVELRSYQRPLHPTRSWRRKSRPYKDYYMYNYICIICNCRNAITQHTTTHTHTHTHQDAGSVQQKGEDNDKKIRMYKDAAFDFSRYNVVILAYSQGIFSKSPYTTEPNIVGVQNEHILLPHHKVQ